VIFVLSFSSKDNNQSNLRTDSGCLNLCVFSFICVNYFIIPISHVFTQAYLHTNIVHTNETELITVR